MYFFFVREHGKNIPFTDLGKVSPGRKVTVCRLGLWDDAEAMELDIVGTVTLIVVVPVVVLRALFTMRLLLLFRRTRRWWWRWSVFPPDVVPPSPPPSLDGPLVTALLIRCDSGGVPALLGNCMGIWIGLRIADGSQ